MTTFAEIMKAESNGRREVSYDLWLSSSLQEQYATLMAEAEQLRKDATDQPDAENRPKRRVGQKVRTAEDAEAEAKALVEANPTARYKARLRAGTRAEWNALKAEHPPIAGNEVDEAYTVHMASIAEPAVRLCLADPEPTDEVMAFLSDTLTSGEWDRIAIAVVFLNEGNREIPLS